MIEFYFYVAVACFGFCLIRFANSLQVLKNSRVREMRLQSGKLVKRDRVNLALSLFWPALLAKSVWDVYKLRKLAVPEYYERKKD